MLVDGEKGRLSRYDEDDDFFEASHEVVKKDVKSRKITIDGTEYGHSQRSDALWKISQTAEKLAEGEKLSINIDGKEVTTKGAAEDAVTAALGDQTPFVAEVGGKRIIGRSDFARAMRDVFGHEFRPMDEVPFRTIAGIPVSIRSERGILGSNFAYIHAEIPHSDGRSGEIDAWVDVTPEKHKKGTPILFTVSNLRPAISKFENLLSLKQGTRYGRDAITGAAERARNDIQALEEALSGTVQARGRTGRKKARLNAVETELNGRKAKEEANKAGAEEGANRTRYNAAANVQATAADKAIWHGRRRKDRCRSPLVHQRGQQAPVQSVSGERTAQPQGGIDTHARQPGRLAVWQLISGAAVRGRLQPEDRHRCIVLARDAERHTSMN